MLEFQGLDWREFNEEPELQDDGSDVSNNDSSNEKYIIRLFGRTMDDKSVAVKITNYTPHFYVSLPSTVGMALNAVVKRLIAELQNKAGKFRQNLVHYDIVDKMKFRYFTNETKFKFLRLIFDNSRAMYIYANNIKNQSKYFKSIFKLPSEDSIDRYESNIDSFLRCIHIRDLFTCGWIQVNNFKNNVDEDSSCNINIVTDWKNLKSCEDQSKSAPFKINSFDIECYSHDGSFPQPHDIRNPVIQIGNVFGRYGGDIYKKIILTLGTCDPIDGAVVYTYNNEREMLLGWIQMIKDEDPDVLIGYNIWQFDENYLAERCKLQEIQCVDAFSKLSKIDHYSCPFIKKQMNSAGMGDNFLKYYETYGRVQCDLMKYLQTNPNYKLSKWSLDTVAETFIQEEIKSYTIIDDSHLEIESNNLHTLQVGNYVKIISQLELEYGLHEEKVKSADDDEDEDDYNYCNEKYRILSINNNKMIIVHNEIKFTSDNLLELGKSLKWGLVKDDIHANDIFRMQKGTSTDRKVIADYCLQDCVLVYRLFAKLEVLTNLIEMANVCSVPLYYLLIRGQGIKSLSLVAKECRKLGYLIPVLDVNLDEDVTFSGAVVFEPKTGFYQRPIFVKDYNSLYPSSIISKNVSHETIVKDMKFDNLPGFKYYDVQYPNNDGTITKCRYAQKEGVDEKGGPKLGIIPMILQRLLAERKLTKKLMEKEKDYFKKSILDGKQNALKVTANSIYGQLGARVGPLFVIELASSTTAIGRTMLETAQNFVENNLTPILQEYAKAFKMNDDDKIIELNNSYLKDNCEDNINHIKMIVTNFFENYEITPKVIYGDSCTGDTPILLKDNNDNLVVKRIDDQLNMWIPYEQFKSNDKNLTNKEQIIFNHEYKIWTHNEWSNVKRIIRHKTDKKIYRIITAQGSVDVTEDHSLLDEHANQVKPVDLTLSTKLLHCAPKIKCYKSDVSRNVQYCDNYQYVDHTTKLDAQITYIELCNNINDAQIEILENDIYRVKWNFTANVIFDTTVKSIELLHAKYNDYVYDVETNEGVFHAGIGSLIIKNTDSIFCDLNIKNKLTGEYIIDKSSLISAINFGKASSMLIKKRLPFPHNLEYEKTFYPFCIMAKKRYLGNKYEENPNKYKQIVMGIALKRRDNANIVKKIYGGLVNITLNENNIEKAMNYVNTSLQKVLDGQYPITDFITTKTLKSKYNGLKITTDHEGQAGIKGTWNWDDVQCSLSHVKLCQRMKQRDPGNAPSANDRIPYLMIYKEKKKGVKMLQSEIIETPDYIKTNNLKIDYLYYITNQLEEPIVQFLQELLPDQNSRAIFNKLIDRENYERCKLAPNSLAKWLKPIINEEATDVRTNYNDPRLFVKTLDEMYEEYGIHNKLSFNVGPDKKPRKKISKSAKIIKELYE